MKTKKRRSGYILAAASIWTGYMFLHAGIASAIFTLFLTILVPIVLNDQF